MKTKLFIILAAILMSCEPKEQITPEPENNNDRVQIVLNKDADITINDSLYKFKFAELNYFKVSKSTITMISTSRVTMSLLSYADTITRELVGNKEIKYQFVSGMFLKVTN